MAGKMLVKLTAGESKEKVWYSEFLISIFRQILSIFCLLFDIQNEFLLLQI